MGFKVTIYEEFTTNETVNKAILGLSIVRLFIFFCIFLLNLNQTIQEIVLTRAKKKSLIINPRFLTYLCITIYPFSRLFMIGVFLGVDKNMDNGGYTVAISIWGTLFQYLEWTFIASFWGRILYTFFIMNEVVLKNKKRVWQGVWTIVVVLVLWTIVQTVFNFYYLDIMNSSYGAGQVVIVCGIGGYYLINGILLFRAIKNTGTQNEQLNQSFRTIKKLAFILLIQVIGIFILFIIQVPVLGLGDYEANNYVFLLCQCMLEYSQLGVVMFSLGGNSFKNYFSIKRIKEIRTGSMKTNSGTNYNHSNNEDSVGIEINLDESSSSLSHKNSSPNLVKSPSKTTVDISVSVDSSLNNSSAHLV